ncbi:MAG TPA: saccharopine dehydrogenase C-terminal domain-containing protein [Longimicrobiaceae bacterium]
MRMLVLGAGQQGSACAYDLLRHTDHEVVIADQRVDALPEFLRPYLGSRLTAVQLDANDRGAVRDVMEGAAAVMNAFPYHFNLGMLVASIDCGAHYADLGGNTEIVLQQKGQHDRARERGVSAVPDSGLAPGMVNILAQHGIGQLDTVRAVRIKVGGLPQHPEPPLNYQIVYSMEGVLDYYTTLSWVLRHGQPTQVAALSEIEEIDFPGAGTLEAFHTAGGLSTMAQRYEGDVPTMEYKTLRYPGHARIMEAIPELGLLGLDPVDVKGQRVVPRDVFIAVAGKKLTKDPRKSPDLVALRVEVEGEKDGEELLLRWDLLDRFDAETGITAMMRTTGYSLAITGALQAAGDVEPGVWTPDEGVPADAYIQALRERGVDIRETRLQGAAANS